MFFNIIFIVWELLRGFHHTEENPCIGPFLYRTHRLWHLPDNYKTHNIWWMTYVCGEWETDLLKSKPTPSWELGTPPSRPSDLSITGGLGVGYFCLFSHLFTIVMESVVDFLHFTHEWQRASRKVPVSRSPRVSIDRVLCVKQQKEGKGLT